LAGDGVDQFLQARTGGRFGRDSAGGSATACRGYRLLADTGGRRRLCGCGGLADDCRLADSAV
jgi:uncharacterized membrane protein